MKKTFIAVVVLAFLAGLLTIAQNAYAENSFVAGQTIISGRILNPDGTPFEMQDGTYLRVRLKNFNSNDEHYLKQVNVDDDGTYELAYDYASGEYELVVLIVGKNIPYVDSLPDPIKVSSGQKYTKDLKLSYPEITGKILTKEGTPLEIFDETIIRVDLWNDDKSFHKTIEVSADGSYSFGGGLPSGGYILRAFAYGNCKYIQSEVINVNFEKGNKIVKDIPLEKANAAGRILKPDGTLYIPEGYAYSLIYIDKVGEDTFGKYGAGIYNGYYNFGKLQDEGDYILRLIPMGDDNPYTASEPVIVHFSPDETVVQDLVYTSPMLKGNILSPDGKSLGGNVAGIEVELRSVEEPYKVENKTVVNKDGSYSIGGVPSGTYILKAINYDIFKSPYCDSMETKIILDEKGIITKDIKLSNPQIYAQIFNTDGSILTSEKNYYFDFSLKSVDGKFEKSLCQTEGKFHLGGFPEGDYYMEAKSHNTDYIKSEIILHLNPDKPIYVDSYLRDTRTKVTGTIKTSFNEYGQDILRGFKVSIEGTDISTVTDSKGQFVIPMLPDDSKSYTFVISKDGYLTRKIKNVTVTDDIRLDTDNGSIIMYCGEIIKDGVINLADIMEIVKRFGSQVKDSGDKICDLNNDGYINMVDIMIAANNFNLCLENSESI